MFLTLLALVLALTGRGPAPGVAAEVNGEPIPLSADKDKFKQYALDEDDFTAVLRDQAEAWLSSTGAGCPPSGDQDDKSRVG